MLKLIIFTVLLNGEIHAIPPDPIKIEARKRRGKGKRGRKRGGNGLR